MDEIVSIITPLFNSITFIEETIESVISQTYNDWEMIIIDDCSNDGSLELVKDIAKDDLRIRLISLKNNLGPSNARNEGIKQACGRYIAFLDSDDLWHKDKLKKQIKFMNSNEYAFTFTGYEKIDEFGDSIGIVLPYKNRVSYQDLLKSNHIGCLTVMLDMKLLGDKKYMPDIIKRQDHGLWLNLLKGVKSAYCLDEILGKYRIRQGSVSINKLTNVKYQWKLYRSIEKMNILQSLYYMAFYSYYGLRKYLNLI